MRKFVFKFDPEESRCIYDLFALIEDGEASQKEMDLTEAMEAMREYKITITVEEVK